MKDEPEIKFSIKRAFGSVLVKFSRSFAVVAVSAAVLCAYLVLPPLADSQVKVGTPKYEPYSGLNDLIANVHAPGQFMIVNTAGGENIIVRTPEVTAFVSLSNSGINNNERRVLTDLGLVGAPDAERAQYASIDSDITSYLSANNFGLSYRSLGFLVAILFGLLFLVIAGLVLAIIYSVYGSLVSNWAYREDLPDSLLSGRPVYHYSLTNKLTHLIYTAILVGSLAVIALGVYRIGQIKTAANGMTSVASVKALITDAQTKPISFAILPASISSSNIEQYNILGLDSTGTVYHLDGVFNSKSSKSDDYTYASLDQVNNDLSTVANLTPATGADLARLQVANTELARQSVTWNEASWQVMVSTFDYLVILLMAGLFGFLLIQDLAIPGPTWGVRPKKAPKPKRAQMLENPKAATAATKKLATSAEELLNRISGKVPPEVYERVKAICDMALTGFNAKGGENTLGDREVFGLTQIVISYLPDGIDTYLSVPKRFADKELRGHRSPYDVLMEQLALIEKDCRYLTETAVLAKTSRLESQERFLAGKVPPASPPPGV
jgi:hypothetical protein